MYIFNIKFISNNMNIEDDMIIRYTINRNRISIELYFIILSNQMYNKIDINS